MKKTVLLVASLLVVATVSDMFNNKAHTNSTGAPQGHTGSPGDGGAVCTNCHSGPAVSNQVVSFTSTVPGTGYVPGSTYTITAALTGGLSNTFGFQASPQNAAGALQGSMTAGTGTQLIGAGNKYITHTAAGNQGTANSKTWTFQWTAPTPGTGAITFYGAFNFASGSNGNQGDVIRTGTIVLAQASGVGIEDVTTRGYAVFPNPATDQLTIALPVAVENATASLFDISGRMTVSEKLNLANGTARMNISDVRAGVYMMVLEFDGQRKVTKLLVD